MPRSKIPTVVIVGRINVGKSTLFNRLTESGKALVSPVPGTTRDYNIGYVQWRKKNFKLIDTGGVNIETLKQSIQTLASAKKIKKLRQVDTIESAIIEQTHRALAQATLVLLVVDGPAGVMPQDRTLASVLRKINKPVMLVCNKLDRPGQRILLGDFFKLGLGTPQPVSAVNGSGSGDFLDELLKKISFPPGRPLSTLAQKTIKIAIVGKPNTGKSTLVNALLGEKRVIVSPLPYTTREPQDTELTYQKKHITLIDTAGLRRKAKVTPGLEKQSTKKTLAAVKRADVVLFVTEAHQGLTRQDAVLANLIYETGLGMILLVNKWDLVKGKTTATDVIIRKRYQAQFPYLVFAPIIFVSAKTGKNVDKILNVALTIYQERQKIITPEKLKEFIKAVTKKHRPVKAKGFAQPRIYDFTQTGSAPPRFAITIGRNQTLHQAYLKFIEKELRVRFGFIGVPVKIYAKEMQK